MKKILIMVLAIFVANSAMAQLSKEEGVKASAKMEVLVKDVENKILKTSISQDQKNKYFDEILVSQMDLDKISNFIVGKPWKLADKKSKEEFLKAFRHFQVLRFKETFNAYSDEEIKINGTLPSASKNQIFVEMQIISKNKQGEPIDVKWKLAKANTDFKITDVVIEGISMASSLKQEYASILNQTPSGQDKLAYLTQKINEKAFTFDKDKKKK